MSSSLQRRFGSLGPEDVARLDAAAGELGVAIAQLMEVAGFQVARCGWRMLGRRPGRVHVVAGQGHNGGDGLVAGRHLAGWGCDVSAGLLGDPDATNDLLTTQIAAARGAGVRVHVSRDPDDVVSGMPGAALTVDALLGTGLREAPRAAMSEVIARLQGIILSIDVPSGVHAGTGATPGLAVRAHTTCTLAGMKRGLWSDASRLHRGRVVVADIGMPAAAWRRCGLVAPTSVRGGRLVTLRQ